jgi:hypothetical protein
MISDINLATGHKSAAGYKGYAFSNSQWNAFDQLQANPLGQVLASMGDEDYYDERQLLSLRNVQKMYIMILSHMQGTGPSISQKYEIEEQIRKRWIPFARLMREGRKTRDWNSFFAVYGK